jgi:hypothetical protein
MLQLKKFSLIRCKIREVIGFDPTVKILLKYLQQQLRFYGNYFTVSKSAEEDVNKLRKNN